MINVNPVITESSLWEFATESHNAIPVQARLLAILLG